MLIVNKYIVRLIYIILTCSILIIGTPGCVKENNNNQDIGNSIISESDPDNEIINEIPLPIVEEPITLKYWVPIGRFLASRVNSYDETPVYSELQKRLGINLDFIHPAVGQESEQFNLMIASNALPDIIVANFVEYNGGPEKAMADNIIVPLNDLIRRYAPNLRKLLRENKEIDKLVKTDSGRYYSFPSVRPDESTLVYLGPVMRKDWLDEAGLHIPETIDEWTVTLKAFKENNGAVAPLIVMLDDIRWNNVLIGSFGIGRDFYVDDNGKTVKYGPYEQKYKDFLITINSWYKDGLIDPDFATNDRRAFEAKIVRQMSGAFFDYFSSPTKYKNAIRLQNPNCEFVAVPYPVINKGDVPEFGQYSSMLRPSYSAHITSANKYLKETTMLLDYAYSEEGNLLYNFGIEGDSYVMVDGYPKYTDKILKSPEGMSNALGIYVFSGPFATDPRYFEQTLTNPAQKEAIKIWANTRAKEHKLPPLTPSSEDSNRLASIMNEVNTYVDEMFLRFIIGQESIDNFDLYIDTLKKIGIEEAIAIQQKALDAFNRR